MSSSSGTLVAAGISKSHGARPVLTDVGLVVQPGARIGLVGPNGVGKTTLLRLLAGEEEPDRGLVRRSPPALAVGHLPQERDARPGETLRAYLARRTGVAAAAERPRRAGGPAGVGAGSGHRACRRARGVPRPRRR